MPPACPTRQPEIFQHLLRNGPPGLWVSEPIPLREKASCFGRMGVKVGDHAPYRNGHATQIHRKKPKLPVHRVDSREKYDYSHIRPWSYL